MVSNFCNMCCELRVFCLQRGHCFTAAYLELLKGEYSSANSDVQGLFALFRHLLGNLGHIDF
jgi:hypothetical protein